MVGAASSRPVFRIQSPFQRAPRALRRAPLRPVRLALPDGCGIAFPNGAAVPPAAILRAWGLHERTATVEAPLVELPFPRTLFWNPVVPLRMDLLPAGFRTLDFWHVAAPLYDYNTLAFQHGTLEERIATAAKIHDLRVPLYETRALFLRRCDETDDLLRAWARERAGGGDERLAFHRALWGLLPAMDESNVEDAAGLLILPLPMTWIEGKHA